MKAIILLLCLLATTILYTNADNGLPALANRVSALEARATALEAENVALSNQVLLLTVESQVRNRVFDYVYAYAAFIEGTGNHSSPIYQANLNRIADVFSEAGSVFNVDGVINFTAPTHTDIVDLFPFLKDNLVKGLAPTVAGNVLVTYLGVDELDRKLASAMFIDQENSVVLFRNQSKADITITRIESMWREEDIGNGMKEWKATDFTIFDYMFLSPLPFEYIRKTQGYHDNTVIAEPDSCPVCVPL